MGNAYIDSSLLDKAIVFATRAHSNTERRGKGFPFIIHPLEALSIVATITNDQEILAAAVLHDTVEDTSVSFEDILEEFGPRVAKLVFDESTIMPSDANPSATWTERKKATVERLAAASLDSKTVAMGDKLSNLRTIAGDYLRIGDEVWKRFSAPGGKKDIEWYYRSLADSLKELAGTSAYQEYEVLLDQTFIKKF